MRDQRMTRDRMLLITVSDAGFLAETMWQNRIGYWSVLSRTMLTKFPSHLIARVAERADYTIKIRRR